MIVALVPRARGRLLEISSEVVTCSYDYGSQQIANEWPDFRSDGIKYLGGVSGCPLALGDLIAIRYRGEVPCLTASALVVDQSLLDPP